MHGRCGITLLGLVVQTASQLPATGHFSYAQDIVNMLIDKLFDSLSPIGQVDLNCTTLGTPCNYAFPTRGTQLLASPSFPRPSLDLVLGSSALRMLSHHPILHVEAALQPNVRVCRSSHRSCCQASTITDDATDFGVASSEEYATQKGKSTGVAAEIDVESSTANLVGNAGWDDLGVDSRLATAMRARMEVFDPNPLQIKSIPTILEGRHTMLCSHTGSGKTLAAIVPFVQQLLRDGPSMDRDNTVTPDVLEFRPKVLILIPYKNLAEQAAHVLYDLLAEIPQLRPMHAKDFLEYRHPDIVVCTPKDLVRLIINSGRGATHKRKGVNFDRLRHMMIDEVDLLIREISDGRTKGKRAFFRMQAAMAKPQKQRELKYAELKRIVQHGGITHMPRKSKMQFVILSASATSDPRKTSILRQLISENIVVFDSSVFSPNSGLEKKMPTMALSPTLTHGVLEVKRRDRRWYLKLSDWIEDKDLAINYHNALYSHKLKLLRHLLKTFRPGENVVIFVNKKRSNDDRLFGGIHQLLGDLIQGGFDAQMLDTANLMQSHGLNSGRVFVAPADGAARGIDTKTVTMIINFDVPDSKENYVHRAGRAGRAGQSGTVITMVATADDDIFFKEELLGELGVTEIHDVDCEIPSASEVGTDMWSRLLNLG